MFDYPTPTDFRAHLVRSKRLFPGAFVAWSIAALGASRLAGMRTGPLELYDLTGAVLCGTLIGGAMAWFETRPVRRNYLNRFPYLDIVLRTLVYTIVVSTAVLIGRSILFTFFPEEAAGDIWRPVREMMGDWRIRRFVILMFLASFALNFFLHLRLAIGPKHLRAMFTGKYRLPVREERLFVFIDLIDSTAIAQRLGPLEFTHFKHDFFCDLADPLRLTDGHIVQYVGDEVMLTWERDELDEEHDPLLFLQLARKRVARRAAYYEQRYHVVPAFRTGIHAGTVVVAEVGDTRRDIVYSGDVVNAAARLLQACRPAGVKLLISDEALRWVAPVPAESIRALEPMTLRGRSEHLHVNTLVPPPASASQAETLSVRPRS